MDAGINVEGTNAEVAAGQWEFQTFAKGAKQAGEVGPWQISLPNLKQKTVKQAKHASIEGGAYLPNLVTKPETETPACLLGHGQARNRLVNQRFFHERVAEK